MQYLYIYYYFIIYSKYRKTFLNTFCLPEQYCFDLDFIYTKSFDACSCHFMNYLIIYYLFITNYL